MTEAELNAVRASGDYGIDPLTGKPRLEPHPYVYDRGTFGELMDLDAGDKAMLTGKQRYGQWSRRAIDMSFHPRPKRSSINADGTLTMVEFPTDQPSHPYDKAQWSEDKASLFMAAQELLEQPDGGDYTAYEREMA
jgi:hypothetical protein